VILAVKNEAVQTKMRCVNSASGGTAGGFATQWGVSAAFRWLAAVDQHGLTAKANVVVVSRKSVAHIGETAQKRSLFIRFAQFTCE
jgi:hypothetical protein